MRWMPQSRGWMDIAKTQREGFLNDMTDSKIYNNKKFHHHLCPAPSPFFCFIRSLLLTSRYKKVVKNSLKKMSRTWGCIPPNRGFLDGLIEVLIYKFC